MELFQFTDDTLILSVPVLSPWNLCLIEISLLCAWGVEWFYVNGLALNKDKTLKISSSQIAQQKMFLGIA